RDLSAGGPLPRHAARQYYRDYPAGAGSNRRLVRGRDPIGERFAMTERLIRGRTLTFLREPESPDDHSACIYCEDGAVLVRNGLIVGNGEYAHVRAHAGS